MTSQAQQSANERNAEKSTGPRTDEGKRRSAMNALKHGGYLAQYGYISATALKEDPDEMEFLIETLIEDLDPATPLEYLQAQAIAQKFLNQQRVDRLAGHLASSQEAADVVTDKHAARRNLVAFWEDLLVAVAVLEGLVEGSVDSERLTREFRRLVPAAKPLEHELADGPVREPATDEEWDGELLSLVRDVMGDGDVGRATILALHQRAESAVDRDNRTVAGIEANLLLEQFRAITDVQDRVQRGLARQLTAYWSLKERGQSHKNAASRNEPNPSI